MGKIKIDDEKAMALYMDGLMDGAIAHELGVAASSIQEWRTRNGLPHNKKLFDWQKKYQGEIPEKYRDPRGI